MPNNGAVKNWKHNGKQMTSVIICKPLSSAEKPYLSSCRSLALTFHLFDCKTFQVYENPELQLFSWALRQQAHLHLFDKPWIRVSEFYIIPTVAAAQGCRYVWLTKTTCLNAWGWSCSCRSGLSPVLAQLGGNKTNRTGMTTRTLANLKNTNPEKLWLFIQNLVLACLHGFISIFTPHTCNLETHMVHGSMVLNLTNVIWTSGLRNWSRRSWRTSAISSFQGSMPLRSPAFCSDKAWTADQLTSETPSSPKTSININAGAASHEAFSRVRCLALTCPKTSQTSRHITTIC